MNTYLDIFLDEADRFGAVVGEAAPESWSAQSPCEKWTAAGVVEHVVDTEREFLARNDLAPGPRPDGAPPEVWRRHIEEVRRILGDGAVLDRAFDGFFGPTTLGETLVGFYAFDLVVHRWDLARAVGSDTAFTEEEMDLLDRSVARFGEHMYDEGVFRGAVPPPAGATRQERLLAVMGRAAR